MRILLITLLLAGCSMADIKGGHEASIEERKGNEKIYHAEIECTDSGLTINTPEYDKCIDEKLEDDPKLRTLLAKLKTQFAKRAADGTVDADRNCENLGYYRNTPAYDICIEYARDNKAGGARKDSPRK